MPNLPRERAADDDVLHGLFSLVAQGTTIIVRQTMPSESSGGPASVKVGEPIKHLDVEGGPTPPSEVPERRGSRSGVKGSIAGFGRVLGVGSPSPK